MLCCSDKLRRDRILADSGVLRGAGVETPARFLAIAAGATVTTRKLPSRPPPFPMRLLDLTLPTPEQNLGLDEWLLEQAIAGQTGEVLRLWEPPTPVVVMGRSTRAEQEVDLAACRQHGVPVLRRVSGGATIVTGPGCLMYAVVLSAAERPELHSLERSHEAVLGRVIEAIRVAGGDAKKDGTSDLVDASTGPLAKQRRKVSGNSLRVKRDWLLYHGTLLYDFDLPLIPTLLRTAPRQPAYRAGRDHGAFVANLPVDGLRLRSALAEVWRASEPMTIGELQPIVALVASRYGRDDWNFSR